MYVCVFFNFDRFYSVLVKLRFANSRSLIIISEITLTGFIQF